MTHLNENALGRWANLGVGRVLFLGISICILLGGVCLLPYAFPPSTFTKGASYEVGFNNTVAYLWYILFLWVPVLALARMFSGASGRVHSISVPTITFAPTPLVWATIVLHALLFAGLYAYKGQFVFADAVYHQTLIYRMTLGDIPYLDFASNYGLAMLYPGYLLSRHLSVEAAYALYFIATYLFGLYLLFRVLAVIVSDAKSVSRWFLLFAIGFFNPWTALNVTFVRYLLPIVAFASAISYFRTGGVRPLAVATSWLALAMLYTFEAGTVALASIVLLVLAVLSHDRLVRLVRWLAGKSSNCLMSHDVALGNESNWLGHATPSVLIRRLGALLCLAFIICIIAFIAMDPSFRALKLYPATALSYSAGAHNFPIYPNLPFLTLVLLTVVAAAMTLSAVREGKFAGYEDLAIGSLVLALLMERGALGPAEPTHFAYYGLPIFFMCLFLTRWNGTAKGAEKWLSLCLVVGIALPLQYYHLRLFIPFVAKQRVHAELSAGTGVAAAGRESIQHILTTMVDRVGRDKPYLMFQLDYYSFPVYRKLGLKYPTYCTSLIEVRTYDDIRLFISQLRASQAVIIARRSDLLPSTSSSDNATHINPLDLLSGATTSGSRLTGLMLRSEERLYQAVRDFIDLSYEVEMELNGIVALVPKPQMENGAAAGSAPALSSDRASKGSS